MRKTLFFLFLGAMILIVNTLMAAELYWSGEYRFRTTYNNSYVNDYEQSLRTSKPINWADMRIRLNTEAQFSDYITMTTQFELKNIVFGSSSLGGGMGTDGRHNLVTRHAYLTADLNALPVVVKIGLMKFLDQAHGLIIDDDAAGMVLSPKQLKELSLGLIVWYDYWDNPQESNNDTNIYFAQFTKEWQDQMISIGSFYEYDRYRRYDATPTDDGSPTYEFYGYLSGCKSFGGLKLDLAMIYNKGHDWRDRQHSGYAISFKPKFTFKRFTLESIILYLSAEDDSDVYVEDEEQGLDYSRKYVDIDYYVAISPYYENGLELFGLGINDHANVEEIMLYIDLGFYGQINYVGKLSYEFNDNISTWFTAGFISRMAEKYIGDDENGDPEFLRQGIATEYDLGISVDLANNLNWKLVGVYAIPNEDYFARNNKEYYAFSTALTYKF